MNTFKIIFITAATIIVEACSGSYDVTRLDDNDIPHTSTIAVAFFQAPSADISRIVTSALLSQLKQYGYTLVVPPEEVDKVLLENNMDLYRNPTSSTIFAAGQRIGSRYLITGNVQNWEGGYYGLTGQRLTKVGFSFRMYDFRTGKELWIAYGEDDEGCSLFGVHSLPGEMVEGMIPKLLKDTTLKPAENARK